MAALKAASRVRQIIGQIGQKYPPGVVSHQITTSRAAMVLATRARIVRVRKRTALSSAGDRIGPGSLDSRRDASHRENLVYGPRRGAATTSRAIPTAANGSADQIEPTSKMPQTS